MSENTNIDVMNENTGIEVASDNPNFSGVYSTWNIWRAGEMEQCLEDDLVAMEESIADLQTGKAEVNHTHSGYTAAGHSHTASEVGASPSNHNHDGAYSPASHNHDSDYADINHGHTPASIGAAPASHNHDSAYAAVNHNHDADYADAGHTHSDKADLVNGKVPVSQIPDEVKEIRIAANIAARNAMTGLFAGLSVYVTDATADSTVSSGGAWYLYNGTSWIKTAESESMDMVLQWANVQGKPSTFPPAAHTHSEYAAAGHNHDSDYADAGHTHTPASIGAAAASHSHNYAAAAHNHDADYADIGHSHTLAALGAAAAVHAHAEYALANPTVITVAGEDLNDYVTAGVYSFAQAYAPTNVPAGTNGWLIVIPWEQGGGTVKQFWLRHGTPGSSDHEVYTRMKTASDNTWCAWTKFYTTKNPPTAAEVGATPAFTNATGGVQYSYGSGSGKNVLTEIGAMGQGLHTVYAIGGTAGNPKTTESWRFLVHKTGATIGWIIAFGSSGSIYTNYQNAAGSFTGWVCIYDADPEVLWFGDYWVTETQTVTPSKKLSDCRNGWVLVWSDYNPDTESPTNGDCFTTVIPKKNVLHQNWNGQNMVAAVPTYLNAEGVLTWVGKRLYVYDDKITGHEVNHVTAARDVALRAIYEY